MILLAIDQSTRRVGYSIYENENLVQFGSFEPEYKLNTDKRIAEIRLWLKNAIKTIGNIDLILLEDIQLQTRINGSNKYFTNQGNNVLTFKVLAQLQGVLINLCNELSLSYEIVSSSTWKSAIGITSSLRDNQKREAIEFVEEKYGLYADEDEADAVCMGYYRIKKEFD